LIIATMRALRQLSPNQVLQVIATDLNAPSSISSWSHQSGNELIDMYDENGRFVFYLRYTPTPTMTPYGLKSDQ
jgi:TusA-related sulfurtransferase